MGNQKKGHISLGDQQSFSKTLITAGRRLTGQQFLPVAPFLIFLNTGTADQTF